MAFALRTSRVVAALLEALGLTGRKVTKAVLVISANDVVRLYVQELPDIQNLEALASELEAVGPNVVVETVGSITVDDFGEVAYGRQQRSNDQDSGGCDPQEGQRR